MTTEYEDERAIQYRRRRRRYSFWKDGIEYIWNPREGQYERWITRGKRRVCVPLNKKNITPQDREALLQFVANSNDEELNLRLRDILSSFAKQGGDRSFSLYQKPNPNARLIETAEEYVEQIDLAEVEEYQEHKAEQRKRNVQKHANLCNEIMLLERFEREIKAKLRQSSPLIQNQERDLGETDVDKLIDDLKDVQSKINKISNGVKTRKTTRSEDRTNVNKRLRLLFPNRGGKELLDEDFQWKARKLFAKYNQEIIAVQVIEIYNTIGRCYNLKGKEFDKPTVAFAKILDRNGKKVLGKYENKKITINEDIKDDPYNLRRAFAHELGHWLESIVCKMGPCNIKWLKQKQGALIKEGKVEIAPFDNYPTLCVDDYAQIVRGVHTELISVAMQELASDPEVFARRSPEHFNCLLENLREMSK